MRVSAVSRINPVGEFETRPQGTRGSQVDHAIDVGPPAVVSVARVRPSPPSGEIAAVTPLKLTAQVRDGIAMFGTGTVTATAVMIMGAGATPSLAADTVQHQLAAAGVAAEALALEHLVGG